MLAYYIVMAIVFFVQALVMLEAYRNLIYTHREIRPKNLKYRPKTAVICPCKGLDTTFDRNIGSLFELDYRDYQIFFVVESAEDPAHSRLSELIEQNNRSARPIETQLLVAGLSEGCSQKLHNLLCAYAAVSEDFEVLAFIDSDICLKDHFLSSLVYPLRRANVGASTGYRWFVPTDNRLSSLSLSAINAFFASCLGPHDWNSTWGGGMAIKREIFKRYNVDKIWQKAGTDDYTLTSAVKQAGLGVIFVPLCYVASYESLSWRQLLQFARRQFLITRVFMPGLWRLAILGVGHFVVAFWASLAITAYLAWSGSAQAIYAAILPVGLFVLSVIKAIARQLMIRRILVQDRDRLALPGILDILAGPLLSIITLGCLIASGMSRKTVWRGKKYILHGPQNTEIVA